MVLPPGHQQMLTSKRPLSKVEKWTLRSVLAGLAVFSVVLLMALSGAHQTTTRGCVDVSILGATGGSAIHQCGDNARALCQSARSVNGFAGETAREVRAACRKAGFPVG